jgi:hypothetical protein
MTINAPQNKLLHALLALTNNTQYKEDLVASFTENRTTKSSELSVDEAQHLITHLKSLTPNPSPEKGEGNKRLTKDAQKSADAEKTNKQRRKLIALAWQMNWTCTKVNANGSTYTACDMNRVNGWCSNYGYLKKPLNDYTLDELPLLLTQFEKAYNDYLKAV